MRIEVEVSDKMGSYSTFGRRFLPGFHVLSNEPDAPREEFEPNVIEIAGSIERFSDPRLTYRFLDEDEAAESLELYDTPKPEANGTPLTHSEAANGNIPELSCPWKEIEMCGVQDFGSKQALGLHLRRKHDGETPTEERYAEYALAHTKGGEDEEEDEES